MASLLLLIPPSMIRRPSSLVAVCVLFALTPCLQAQQAAKNQAAQNQFVEKNDVQLLTSDLVAWTEMQSPRPIPGVTRQFLGRISQTGSTYFLEIPGEQKFELGQEIDCRPFQDRQVLVLGALESGKNVIHLIKIEPAL